MKTNFSEDFLKHLHDEKLDTQEVRSKYVIRKLVFATALLSAGATNIEKIDLSSLLYLVPFVTIAFDLYIFSRSRKRKMRMAKNDISQVKQILNRMSEHACQAT